MATALSLTCSRSTGRAQRPFRSRMNGQHPVACRWPRRRVEDSRLPISGYNYSALHDRLEKRGIHVSATTITTRAKALGCYRPRPKNKDHDREVLTTSIGPLVQHNASFHLWPPPRQGEVDPHHLYRRLQPEAPLRRLLLPGDDLGPHPGGPNPNGIGWNPAPLPWSRSPAGSQVVVGERGLRIEAGCLAAGPEAQPTARTTRSPRVPCPCFPVSSYSSWWR